MELANWRAYTCKHYFAYDATLAALISSFAVSDGSPSHVVRVPHYALCDACRKVWEPRAAEMPSRRRSGSGFDVTSARLAQRRRVYLRVTLSSTGPRVPPLRHEDPV